MPNWCSGFVSVKGKSKNVENFCKLFIFNEEVGEKGKKYFARSFVHQDWISFKEEYFGDITTETEWDIQFPMDFAWSCWSCIFEGYPQDYPECVTLEWAIKKYNVEVEIETEEGGMGFEEHITTKDGEPVYSSEEMPEHICQKCKSKQAIPSSYDLYSQECYECGAVSWKDELTEILKEKIENLEETKDD